VRASKTIFLLNVNGYSKEIRAITYPLVSHYARKIGAEIVEITKRKFPGWPPVYEKLQIYSLAKTEWNIYIDSDALIHPETVDFTLYVPKDTVIETGFDQASVRWRYDHYFQRDGRNIGCCNWFTIASNWCLDLWRPIDDMSLTQVLENIYPTVEELNTVITTDHLIDDYALSRNIARFGLKFQTTGDILQKIGLKDAVFFWHAYTVTAEEKVRQMQEVLERWKIPAGILKNGQ
jgi:Aspartate ammonia-lyase